MRNKLLLVLLTLAAETRWDNESDLETHLLSTNEVQRNEVLYAYSNLALKYGDIFNYVFRDGISTDLNDFVEGMTEIRNHDMGAFAFSIYTLEDPQLVFTIADLNEINDMEII